MNVIQRIVKLLLVAALGGAIVWGVLPVDAASATVTSSPANLSAPQF